MGEEFKGDSIPSLSRAKSSPWTGSCVWVGSSGMKSDANSHSELWLARLPERGFCDQNPANLQSKSSSLCHSKASSWRLFDIRVCGHEWFYISLIFGSSHFLNSTMKLSWLVKLSTEMLKKISFCTAASEGRLVFIGVFFPIFGGCEGFIASICQMWVF